MKLDRRAALFLPLACLALGLLQDSRPTSAPSPGAKAPAVAQDPAKLGEPVSVFLVRHAEKGTDDPQDPALSEVGEARALDLATLLGHSGVTHLFSSEYVRTRSTLAPLAERVGLEVEVVGARDERNLLARIYQLAPGSVAVVSGHSNTVPSIARALGCEIPNLTDTPRGQMLGESEYDRLFLVTLPPAPPEPGQPGQGVSAKLIELRY